MTIGRYYGGGRKTVYTEAIAEEICERLAAGESLNAICRSDHMPAETRVRAWVMNDQASEDGTGKGFAKRYHEARALGYERLADEILEISDASCMLEGRPDNALVQQARLRTDNRKWFLSKVLPKRFGDKVTAEITGDPNAPLLTRIELVAVPSTRSLPAPDVNADVIEGEVAAKEE